MRLRFYNRDFTDKPIQPSLEFEIQRYGWDVMGGPTTATVTATGERDALFELVNHIREPIEILNDLGDRVWWGYLQALEIAAGAVTFGVDIDTMSNQVAVAYTLGNERFTTQWSGDADSIAEYGYKEMLLSHSDCTEADALSERDTYMAAAKHPIPVIKFSGSSAGTAQLTLRGWWSTLEWRYYLNGLGLESYESTGDGGREVGEDDRPILAMSFVIGSTTGWTATTLWLHIWWQGTSQPSDNLVATIRTNNGGVPGTVLATGTVAGSSVPSSAEWVEFTLNTGVALSTATTYFIVVARSGAVNAGSYYMIDTNRALGYPRGQLYLYYTNNSAWGIAATKGDLLFRLEGTISTTTQITTLIASVGQFLSGTILEGLSGVDTTPYRSGDSTGLYELLKLLGIGTSNSRRLLAEITPNRYVRIHEEPARPSTPNGAYGLGDGGQLYFPGTHNLVNGELCPVGIWCRLVDVIPATVDLSLISDPSLFFVDEAEYDARSGEYRITRTRDQANLYSIGGVEQG